MWDVMFLAQANSKPPRQVSDSGSCSRNAKLSKSHSAHKTLKAVWVFKTVFDALLTAALLFVLATAKISVDMALVPALMAASVGLWVIQCVAVVGLYLRNPWSLWVLHVFSLVSFLQVPVGTVLAAIHFANVRHLDFSHSS